MRDINYLEIGKRIQKQRKNLKITQEQLSEKIDVAPSYISEIERATSTPSIAVIVKIANVLDLNLDYLICGVNFSNIEGRFKELLRDIPEKNHSLFMDLCTSIADPLKK